MIALLPTSGLRRCFPDEEISMLGVCDNGTTPSILRTLESQV
jgi:hypothetical protein